MPKIIVDSREDVFAKKIVNKLIELGAEVEVETLEYGDYVCGNVLYERMTYNDFLNKLVEGRLFDQIKGIKSFEGDAAVILEGAFVRSPIKRKFSIMSLAGLLSSIAVGFGVPIIPSYSPFFTAAIIYTTARRAEGGEETYPVRFKPKLERLDEKARFIVESLPLISSKRAENLLKHFGSVRNIFEHIDQIDVVEGVGEGVKREVLKVIDYNFASKK